MNTLDDAALILQFVRREVTLAANQSLRVESAFDSVQLLAKRGGVIASIKPIDNTLTITVRRSSEYFSLLHHVLLEHHFLPLTEGDQSFQQYQHCKVPTGYRLNCTEARALWKEWWTSVRHGNRNAIQMDLLISIRNTWYPVREIICSQGTLFVKTLGSELIFEGSESIAWLSRLPNIGDRPPHPSNAEASTQVAPTVPTGKSGLPNQPVPQESPLPTVAPPTQQPALTTPQPPSVRQERTEDKGFRPDLRQIIRFRQGKLYITTELGELVVEGANLKFWLNEDNHPAIPNTVDFKSYRDRGTGIAPNQIAL